MSREEAGDGRDVMRGISLAAGLGLTAGLLLFAYARILQANAGVFVYTLDDPYIHLALADRIAAGHYGINASEPSAPSSSIIWPFLLAPFAFLGRFDLVPLLLNVFAAAGTVVTVWKVLGLLVRVPDRRVEAAASAVLLALFVPAGNVVGLVFTGMEHSAQAFLAALLVYGLVRELETGLCSPVLAVAAVLGPLVRYENLALSAAAILVLVGGFSLFLVHLGLRPLPTSVLAKSPAVATGGSLWAVRQNLVANLSVERGVLLTAVLATFLLVAVLSRREDGGRALSGAAAVAVGLHLLLGRTGWFHRYEIAVWVFALLYLLWLVRRPVSGFLGRGHPILRLGAFAAGSAAFVFLTSRPYVTALRTTPLASNNIYCQQLQMRRFTVDFWQRPVAVNDLGWVAYRNPRTVLDLSGLASPEVLAHLRHDRTSQWIDDLARDRGVELVIIYPRIYPLLPPQWKALGELRLSGPLITPFDRSVSFFALSPEAEEDARRLLRLFRRDLPDGVRFVFPDET